MNESKTIILKSWNSDSSRIEETGETLSTYTIAKSLSLENFTALLDEFLNLGGKGFREGQLVGQQLRTTHRTLQRLAVCFALGIIAGLSEQEHTDPRNEFAIQTAKVVAQMLDDDELPLGPYL